MKKYLYIFIALIIFPSISFASVMPKFPMAFYGNVTINGTKAPEGTIIRTYCTNHADTVFGQSIVDSSGNYGYIDSLSKKLLVGECSGTIIFRFETPSILSGVESTGTTAISYTGFEEGLTINKDLAFTYTVVSSGGGGGGGSSGGGGGSSGGGVNTTSITPVITTIPTTTSIVIPGCENRTTGYSAISGQSCSKNLVTPINPISNLSNTPLSNSGLSTYNLGTKTLKNGSRGEAVKELQRFLNDTLKLGLVLDGKLGPKTIAVIKQWQKSKGLVPDGLIGPKTKAMMNGK